MSTPTRLQNNIDLYNTYSPEDISEKSRFIPGNLNGRFVSKESIGGDLKALNQRLCSKESRSFEFEKVLLELEEYTLAEVNTLNDPSITNRFYRLKTQAIALLVLDAYETSGQSKFPEDDTFQLIEQLQTVRSPSQIVWDCVFGSDATKALNLKKVHAEFLVKSILAADDKMETLKTPLIADSLVEAAAEPFFYDREFSILSNKKAVESLEAFEKSKSFIERASDFIRCKNDVKKAIAIAKSWPSADTMYDSPMKKIAQVNSYGHTKL